MAIRSCLLLAVLLFWSHGARANWATIVFEFESGMILQAENDRELRYPASLTKIMTAYLVLESVKSGRLKLSDPLTISAAAASQPATHLGLKKGRTITVEEALQAMILRSANDAAVVLAEAVAGSERAFAIQMSGKARALGMPSTKFANATGLPVLNQVTSAHDMAVLARALIRNFPDYFPLFSQTSFAYRKKRYRTINGWLTGFKGADGIKTGFTCAAGYNLVASAKRDGRRLIAVIMGGTSSAARNSKASLLINRAFEMVGQSGGTIPRMSVLGGVPGWFQKGDPPHVLPVSRCAVSKNAARGALEGGPFPGWGIIFGSYIDEAKALATIKRNRATLGKLVKSARAAVVPKAREGVSRFSALLVGLNESAATNACKRLWETGAYCLRLGPAVLNNKKALWR